MWKNFPFSVTNASNGNVLWCPCMKCGNMKLHIIKDVICHIYHNGFDANYKRQIWHDECLEYGVCISSQFENIYIYIAFDENDHGMMVRKTQRLTKQNRSILLLIILIKKTYLMILMHFKSYLSMESNFCIQIVLNLTKL